MPSMSDLRRSWLLKMMGLSSSTLSEADLSAQMYGDTSFNNGTRRVAEPVPVAGSYVIPRNTVMGTTALTNSLFRCYPVIINKNITIDRLGAEITTVGEAGSLLRLGIYRDDGNSRPSALVIDAGTILGDSATLQEKTITPTLLEAGTYWFGAAPQAAPTTPPTIRTITGDPVILVGKTSIPTAGESFGGLSFTAVGALVTTPALLGPVGSVPRLFFRLA